MALMVCIHSITQQISAAMHHQRLAVVAAVWVVVAVAAVVLGAVTLAGAVVGFVVGEDVEEAEEAAAVNLEPQKASATGTQESATNVLTYHRSSPPPPFFLGIKKTFLYTGFTIQHPNLCQANECNAECDDNDRI
jgi:hypothetical protein